MNFEGEQPILGGLGETPENLMPVPLDLKETVADEEPLPLNDALISAEERFPELRDVDQTQLKEVLGSVLTEMRQLQEAARATSFHISDEEAKHVKALWVLGGPGTYLQEAFEDDTYRKDWSLWMDKNRLNKVVQLVRRITQLSSGEDITHRDKAERPTDEEISRAQDTISEYGPTIIYTGGDLHNDPIREFLAANPSIIPPEKLALTQGSVANTVDEVRRFQLPSDLADDDILGIVTHAPQVPRVMRLLAEAGLPQAVKLHVFPLPSPPQADPWDFEKIQAGSILNDVFLTKAAATEPLAYTL